MNKVKKNRLSNLPGASSSFKSNLDFRLISEKEICSILGQRLRDQRKVKKLRQQDLAERSGLAIGTVKNLETKGQCTLESLVRVAVVLDLTEDLGQLFNLKITSIALMEKIENWQRLPKRVRG